MFRRAGALPVVAGTPSWIAVALRYQTPNAVASTTAEPLATAASATESEVPLRAVSRYRVKRKAAAPIMGVHPSGNPQLQPAPATSSGKVESYATAQLKNADKIETVPLAATSSTAGTPATQADTSNKKSLWGGKASSCATESDAPVKPLSALQRRMAAMADKPKFSLTNNALYRIKTLLQLRTPEPGETEDDKPIGIRVGIKKRGCSGLSYTVNYEPKENPKFRKPGDAKIEQGGIWVYVDADALFYVIGTKMDFTVSQVEEKFTFMNPNEKESCGCGESFQPFDA